MQHTPRTLDIISLATMTLGLAIGNLACREAHAKVKGPGDSLKAFIIQNCATHERYCQVCAFSGSPTVMAVGDVDDAGFIKDLKEIQSLYEAHKGQGLTAFALYGKFKDGKFTSVSEDKATLTRLTDLQKELGLTFPVTVLPRTLTPKEARNYTPFGDNYEVTQSRTIMVAKANNKIVWSDVLKGDATQYAALAEAVKKVL